jgi:tetratricopeptide (TPR) repeat protein
MISRLRPLWPIPWLLAVALAPAAHAQTLPLPAAAPASSVIPEGPGFGLADAAYKNYARGDYAAAARDARRAVALEPDNRNYLHLLLDSLVGAKDYDEADAVATRLLGGDSHDAALLAQRGTIRRRLGKNALAVEDFDAALRIGDLPISANMSMLLDLDRKPEARQMFDQGQANGALAGLPDVEVAYLALRVDNSPAALAAFNRADTAGQLANTAYLDAAFAAVHAREDAQAIAYFERSIDDTYASKLDRTPQQLFETRRAVSEVSREFGVFSSLTYYRGPVTVFGLAPGASQGGDAASLQAGIEGYWRFLGYQDGRYSELFARGFETLYSQNGGATGGATLTTGAGIRKKPFSAIDLVVSFSRVFAPSGGRDDWLAQLGYSGGFGGDLRVDVPSWWTTRVSAEAGRYFVAREDYGLVHAEIGKSFRLNEGDDAWVAFPHLSVAADYDSSALQQSSAGIGPGMGLRYWFRSDLYHAPRSYLDIYLQYRERLSGADRAKGLFMNATLSF